MILTDWDVECSKGTRTMLTHISLLVQLLNIIAYQDIHIIQYLNPFFGKTGYCSIFLAISGLVIHNLIFSTMEFT